jgi:hypothetical protein
MNTCGRAQVNVRVFSKSWLEKVIGELGTVVAKNKPLPQPEIEPQITQHMSHLCNLYLLTLIAEPATWRRVPTLWSLVSYEVPSLGVVRLENMYKNSIDVGIFWSVSWDRANPLFSSPLVHPADTRESAIWMVWKKIVVVYLRPFAL